MLQYGSIPSWKKSTLGKPCYAFNKYDGSNLRWEWNPKKGWVKYGTRTQLFDKNTPLYNQAIEIFHDTIGDVVSENICHTYGKKIDRITAFTEFFGKSSFAGSHDFDEPKELKLFDVSVYKKGFISPKEFVKYFSHHDFAAEVVYEGNMNHEFITAVRNGEYPVYEGVICKGSNWSAKIKTIEYLTRLKGIDEKKWEEEKDE